MVGSAEANTVCGQSGVFTSGKAQSFPRFASLSSSEDRPTCHSGGVQLGRIAWMITTFVCVVATVIVLIRGDRGYAVVAFAVAVSAGINLL